MAKRIEGAFAFANFEMKLRADDVARGADFGNNLAGTHFVAAPDQKSFIMSIGCHPTALMFDQQEITKPAQLIAGVGDNTTTGRPDRGPFRRDNVDAVIMQSLPLRAID